MFKLRMVMEGRLLIHDGTSARQYHALIAIIHSSDSNMIHKGNRHRRNVFQRALSQRTSTEVNVYMRRHKNAPFCTNYVRIKRQEKKVFPKDVERIVRRCVIIKK